MVSLKLGKLPDRTPTKITISVSADLGRALQDYAVLYRETYGESETVADLIPFMLADFLEGDRVFAKARKQEQVLGNVSEKSRRVQDSRSE